MERSEVPSLDRWNVEALYSSLEVWYEEFNQLERKDLDSQWSQLTSFQGRLAEGAKVLRKVLKNYFDLEQRISQLYTYAYLRADEDVGNSQSQEILNKIRILIQEFQKDTSWFEPELLQLSEKELHQICHSSELQEYRFYLEKIIRKKPHVLSSDQEKILASASLALQASSSIFRAFDNADLQFSPIKDSQGKEHILTHAKYYSYLRSSDRELRKNAFQAILNTYGKWGNTLCQMIQGKIHHSVFESKTRHFSSSLEAALFADHIDESVYHNLIATVRKNLPIFHQYMNLRKEVLKVSELHLYDIHVPLVSDIEIKFDYEEAKRIVIESVAPLGFAYQEALRKGLNEDRWVDKYENNRKRSGAYSGGCYGNLPFILMNYNGDFQDMMTLAHEAGHSMHSFLSWKNQSYHNADYSIFLAEIASTFNEELISDYLMNRLDDPLKKAYLINQKIQDIYATFFRQTMFAEFELKIHEFIEKGNPLTLDLLKEVYLKLVADYFGPSVVIDKEISMEWSRISHFYRNFYVYQYATGISAAHALFHLVKKEGPKAYLEFLSAGGSRFSLDLLTSAGVDMRESSSIEAIIQHFSKLVEELREALINSALV